MQRASENPAIYKNNLLRHLIHHLRENNDNKQFNPLQQRTPHFWKTPQLVT
jgi:hypothetical protein